MNGLNQNSCFTIAAFAVILDELDRVLLCHRRDMDMWNLPGGGVEKGKLLAKIWFNSLPKVKLILSLFQYPHQLWLFPNRQNSPPFLR